VVLVDSLAGWVRAALRIHGSTYPYGASGEMQHRIEPSFLSVLFTTYGARGSFVEFGKTEINSRLLEVDLSSKPEGWDRYSSPLLRATAADMA
jgi:hypothetical protein